MEISSFPALVLEYVEAEPLGIRVGPGGPVVPPSLLQCLAALAAAGVVTTSTKLVVTGDFIRSVRDRGNTAYHANYDIRRSAGEVAGKTIPMPDGTVDVLINAGWFAAGVDEAFNDATTPVVSGAVRIVLHEAQHVLIAQAGEGGPAFEDQRWARRNLLTAADQVIEEYRAEAVCSGIFGSDWASHLVSVLETWHADLERIACVEYQQHLDAGRLSYDIVQQTHTVWKVLGYVVAELTAGSGLKLAPAVTDHALWRLMVEPHWERFTTILSSVPDATQRVSRDVLNSFAGELADECKDWLLSLGFEYSDGPSGASFWIHDWTLFDGDWVASAGAEVGSGA